MSVKRDLVVLDTEVYRNYVLVAMKNVRNGKIVTLDMKQGGELDRFKLMELLRAYTIVTFNGNSFDIPILAMVLAGKDCASIKYAADCIIQNNLRPWIFERQFGVSIPQLDHIDLIEVAPLQASLKIYNGRLHGQRMQDLPYDPDDNLTDDQIAILRDYCINDLAATELLLKACEEPIELREVMGREYDLDLRSKSDAQVAETVIKAELEKLTGQKPQKPDPMAMRSFKYQIPEWMQFKTPNLQELLERVREHTFELDAGDRVIAPEFLKDTPYKVGNSSYALGIGGMHSMEQSVGYVATEDMLLIDRDVASYYPRIILTQGLFPKHLGQPFLQVYNALVERRLAAKRSGRKLIADSLKIAANGSFGKLGSPYSVLFAPDLMLQVTLSGQLCLLMLIEDLSIHGFNTISGNTDGFVTQVPADRLEVFNQIVHGWEAVTGFETEETRYRAIYSRDVNGYLAVKTDGTTKGKGPYGNPWRDIEKKPDWRGMMSLTPFSSICVEAVEARIVKGTPVEQTIRACRDIRKFLSVRTVKGGAVYDGEYLGKAVRWYYGHTSAGAIFYKSSGNKVATSDGAVPCMELPDAFPGDVNFDYYVARAIDMLGDIGFLPQIDKTHPYQMALAGICKEISRAEKKAARAKR